MSEAWLEVTAGGVTRRHDLARGLTRVGGPGCDVAVEGVGEGQLHVWDDPPKIVRVGEGPPLVLDGTERDEVDLAGGERLTWGPVGLRYAVPPPVLEELPAEPTEGAGAGPEATAGGALGAQEKRAWDRLLAGVLVELKLADKKVKKRWQSAVLAGEWDADACAREILAASPGAGADPRVVERAGRLERDLLMTDFQRGIRKAARSARGAARSGSAFIVANLIGILCYSAIVMALLILARVKYEWSLDGVIDRMVEAVTPG